MHYWQKGGLPNDDAQLARICRATPKEWRAIRDTIAAFFDDGWKHKRIEAELKRTSEVAETYASRAKKAANKRWSKDSPSNASSIPQGVLGDAEPQPQPHKSSEANASGGEPPKPLPPLDLLWMEAPEKLMGLGLKEREARLMVGKWLRDGHGPEPVHAAVDEAVRAKTGDPVSYVTRVLNPSNTNGVRHAGTPRKPSASDIARTWLAEAERDAEQERPLLQITGH
jgi:hypothetical protein